RTWQPTLGELGVHVDARSLAERAYQIGRVGTPIQRSLAIASALLHPVELTAPTVDRDKLTVWVNTAASAFDRPPTEATLAISPSGAVASTPDSPGRQLNRSAAARATKSQPAADIEPNDAMPP